MIRGPGSEIKGHWPVVKGHWSGFTAQGSLLRGLDHLGQVIKTCLNFHFQNALRWVDSFDSVESVGS